MKCDSNEAGKSALRADSAHPDFRKEAESIRVEWVRSPDLDLKTLPEADAPGGSVAEPDVLAKNVCQRMEHLAEVLALLHSIYAENKQLYGDRFLAFVGNCVVREWPGTDLPAISANAIRVLAPEPSDATTESIANQFSRVDRNRVGYLPKSVQESISSSLKYEHVTPIAFFRDALRNYQPLPKEVFFHLLQDNYRIAWVTKSENKALDGKGWKSCRPVDAYVNLNPPIELIESEVHAYVRGYVKS